VTDAVCKAALLTEQQYQRFGDMPPLPMHAFHRGGWRSPLV
jgi:hypothetical protein